MPTKEELELYAGSEGGSGEVEHDKEVVEMLSSALQVSDGHLVAFVKTRDRGTVQGLRQVLKEMPNLAKGQHLVRSSTAPSLTPEQRRAEKRLNEMCKMTSSYSSNFGDGGVGGRKVAKAWAPHDNAFDGLRADYRPTFDDWKKSASESQLRVFAETCRSLRYFNSPGLHTTTYSAEFPVYKNMADARCKLPQKDLTVSNVPLGNIGKTSEADKKAFQARQNVHEEQIAEARRRAKAVHDGTALRPENRMIITGSFSAEMKVPKGQTVGQEQGAPAQSRDWKAISRTSWNGDVHSKTQVARHGHFRWTVGEEKRREMGRTMSFQRVAQEHAEDGREHFNVSNPKDVSGTIRNRFTYSKFAGFTP
eukprot:TRINITY_DN55702_c0_g1_i1.p1 TRINITY_DN55702_c0_g1~~TRINITY_DN55702_c0_g1_i1.p1  ORF type:complete len:364 (+),score=72.11 TRINITY_DN55702_c0_g1_i1:157-1248(+)